MALRARSALSNLVLSVTYVAHQTGLTAGANTFELQAKVSANNGQLVNPSIAVIPLLA